MKTSKNPHIYKIVDKAIIDTTIIYIYKDASDNTIVKLKGPLLTKFHVNLISTWVDVFQKIMPLSTFLAHSVQGEERTGQ